jgi:hypothetical protein
MMNGFAVTDFQVRTRQSPKLNADLRPAIALLSQIILTSSSPAQRM